ncbi:MAG: formate/nitrite transporter family protein [Clostridia bacterium]|nr:formate/nitrite transporter family protein [Clostridia bacterium]
MLAKLLSGISAGLLISVGGTVFLACDNKVVGAVFFSVALLCICYKKYSLFTGRIGYAIRDRSKDYFSGLFLGLLGNIIGTVVCGILVRLAIPSLIEKAQAACAPRLEQAFYQTLIRALFCGVLMYLAVSIFSDHKTPLAILFCIPVFILSGFEHSIADVFYFSVKGLPDLQTIGFLATVVLGNTVGALILPAINPKERIRNQ